MPEGADPALMQDFLTEAWELVERLDADLVTLESEPASAALLDQIFRALHTIKGAASFLSLGALTGFAHAAEDALNRLRKGEIRVTPPVIDAMLRSVDVLRGQLTAIGGGYEPSPGPEDLIAQLRAIAGGTGAAPATHASAVPAGARGPTAVDAPKDASVPFCGARLRPLNLAAEKADILPFMIEDLRESVAQMDAALARGDRLGVDLQAAAAAVRPIGDYFQLGALRRLGELIEISSAVIAAAPPDARAECVLRLRAVALLLSAAGDCLAAGHEPEWELDTFASRLEGSLMGSTNPQSLPALRAGDPLLILAADGMIAGDPGASARVDSAPAAGVRAEADAPGDRAEAERRGDKGGERGGAAGPAESTVRVEVERLETLLNLVGELVLNKNQIMGLSRQLRSLGLPHELQQSLSGALSDLDRLTAELQVGVMRTRMQPLNKLFGKYTRVVRDLARKTGKEVELVIEGGETEVDKSVLELLADPLVHMIRNSVDHGLEKPEAREHAGKSRVGTVRLSAQHQGGHVRVAIRDDGRGIDKARVGAKAVERGLITGEQLAAMSDREVCRLIFAPGLSTAEQVSDLSGRGVGMDVVLTNINTLGGQVTVESSPGGGTMIEILIPLTVAIMPAMMVGIGKHDYAVPVSCIREIVRPERRQLRTLGGQPVFRLRDSVLPLIDMRDRLGEARSSENDGFAVVVGVGQQAAGLLVDRLIGQQEVVIKPLDDAYTSGGPFSGATIAEDGEVSLILDVIRLLRSCSPAEAAAA
ncbi:MAG: chemotaxis protein CheA [Phycisphaerales bacterium]|nr:chemotaxis protein CheA [Phycisphaerales bacterium]